MMFPEEHDEEYFVIELLRAKALFNMRVVLSDTSVRKSLIVHCALLDFFCFFAEPVPVARNPAPPTKPKPANPYAPRKPQPVQYNDDGGF